MSFLEAHKAIDAVSEIPARHLRLLGSGMFDNLVLFIRAAYARRGINADVSTLPFGTLHQFLADNDGPGDYAIAVVMPWDLCSETDWRTGVIEADPCLDDLIAVADATMVRLAKRCQTRCVYLDAPLAPVFRNHHDQSALRDALRASATKAGAAILPADLFSLSNHLASGAPVAGNRLDIVAETLVTHALDVERRGIGKVLVTDLDNCLWRGVVGEDGPDNVSAAPDGASFVHFIYQTYLRKLKADGILLAAASRNDPDLAQAPLERGAMPLSGADFVMIKAGYGQKSDALRQIATELNLGLDSLVFVDDNPVELAEVNATAPEVTTVTFAADEAGLLTMYASLDLLFHRDALTDDDARRHEYYRNRATTAERAAQAGSVTEFLAGLEMRLTVHTRTPETWTRAIQLINKTSQFNVNGRKWSEDEVAAVLSEGGRLFTAELSDNTGDHGEIISFLIGGDGRVRAFVMSCRVFQRRVEYAFLLALKDHLGAVLPLPFEETARNTPFSLFINEPAFTVSGDEITCDIGMLHATHQDDLNLFTIDIRNE